MSWDSDEGRRDPPFVEFFAIGRHRYLTLLLSRAGFGAGKKIT
jgi:hypothetical protein